MYSNNPTSDAIDYINRLDRNPGIDADYLCDGCGDGFNKGQGVKITDEKFCHCCIQEKKYIGFYKKECGLNEVQIAELEFYITKI